MNLIKKITLLAGIFLISTSFNSKKDFFEGIIVYTHLYESHSPQLNAEKMAQLYGTESTFYYKNGNYVQLFNGTLLKMNLYEVESNILRMQYSHIDTLININLGGINEKLKKIGIEKSKERVLNYDCDILTVESDDLKDNPLRKASYYFNPEFPINSKWYEKQKASSYNVIYEKMEALPIKIIVAKKDLTITMIATSIHKQLIPDSVFIKRLTLY